MAVKQLLTREGYDLTYLHVLETLDCLGFVSRISDHFCTAFARNISAMKILT